MRTIVIGDIHGCYKELRQLIKDVRYNRNYDKLVFLGDYIDRGEGAYKVIKYIKKLQSRSKNVIVLRGNHEQMAIDFNKYGDDLWKFNGALQTLNSYQDKNIQLAKDIKWMETLPLYHEDEHFIYVHAGVNYNRKLIEEQSDFDLLWIRDNFIYQNKQYYKKIIFGHTPTQFVTETDKPYYTFGGNVGIDTGCVYGGKLTALIINDDKIERFYQVDKIKNEK